MFALILPAITSLITGAFDNWKAGQDDARKIAAAVAENKQRLALDTQSHNADWEMAALQGGDKWLRRVSFFMWSAPLLLAYFSPAAARAYFAESLAGLPEWYIGGYLAMTGAIWGLSELKAMGAFRK